MSDLAIANKMLGAIKSGSLKNINCFDGEETYYISQIENAFENNLLNETEKGFNLHIYYGLDSLWGTIVNTCQQSPMFGDRMVVIVKEAQDLKNINELAPYLEKLPKSTYLLISHKYKKLDGRGALAKALKKLGTYHTFTKMYDNQIPRWIMTYAKEHGLSISDANANLLAINLGNQLEKIANELEKVRLNLREGEVEITGEHIERYIGISKDYNFFEFTDALIERNKQKAYCILRYIEGNAKAMPITVSIATLYSALHNMHTYLLMAKPSIDVFTKEMKLAPFAAKKAINYAERYSEIQIRNGLKLLYEIAQKDRGIGGTVATDELYKELVGRFFNL